MIAVICGGGSLPHAVCTELTAEKKDFFILALNPHTQGSHFTLHASAQKVIEVPWYEVEKILSTLQDNRTNEVVLIGKFDKRCLFQAWKLDRLGRSLLGRVHAWGDGSMLKSISSFFNDYGMAVIPQDHILNRQFVPANKTFFSLTKDQQEDVTFGLQIAEQMSRLDISQTVIVKNKSVIAIEGVEGTNECIARAQTYGINGLVMCKTASPLMGKSLDIPTLGPDTLAVIDSTRTSLIAWHHDRTLIVKSDLFFSTAQSRGLSLIAI